MNYLGISALTPATTPETLETMQKVQNILLPDTIPGTTAFTGTLTTDKTDYLNFTNPYEFVTKDYTDFTTASKTLLLDRVSDGATFTTVAFESITGNIDYLVQLTRILQCPAIPPDGANSDRGWEVIDPALFQFNISLYISNNAQPVYMRLVNTDDGVVASRTVQVGAGFATLNTLLRAPVFASIVHLIVTSTASFDIGSADPMLQSHQSVTKVGVADPTFS